MPVTIDPGGSKSRDALSYNMRNVTPYKYPNGLNLRPDSELHNRLVRTLCAKARVGASAIMEKKKAWKKITRTLSAYIPLTDKEEMMKDKYPNRPVSIVFPMSHAIMDTYLTYMVASFLDNPLLKFQGWGPEDRIKAMLMENVVDLQMQRSKAGMNMHTFWRDAVAYGFGVLAPVWCKEVVQIGRPKKRGMLGGLARIIGAGSSDDYDIVDEVLFEGNKLVNIDPYRYIPDPNVPVQDVQAGEYVGWCLRENRLSLLTKEAASYGSMFNVRYLKDMSNRTMIYDSTGGIRGEESRPNMIPSGLPDHFDSNDDDNRVDVLYLYVNLVPDEWGLGDSRLPEKWLFAVAGDRILIQAQPLNLLHNRFPVAVTAPNTDGYSVGPTSILELISGMQEVIDWQGNSYVQASVQSINGAWVIDPSVINPFDLKNRDAGDRVIRTLRQSWGKDIRMAIQQLNTSEITRNNIGDMAALNDMMMRSTGANDSAQGVVRRGGERVSATESRDAKLSTLSRLDKVAKMCFLQGHYDLAYMIAMQTQQLMENTQFVNIAGRYAEELRLVYGNDAQQIPVGKDDISCVFDVVPYDGGSQDADAQSLLMAFQMLLGAPNVSMQLGIDPANVFKRFLRALNIKDVSQLVGAAKPANIIPDAVIERQVQAGNMIPYGGGSPYAGGEEPTNPTGAGYTQGVSG